MIARFCCKLESQKPKMPECCPFDAILAQAQEKVSARWGRVSAAMLTLARRIRLGAPRPMVRAYHETVHDHFHNPRNVGSLDKNDPKVGTAIVGKASCGDMIKLQIKVEDDGTISDAMLPLDQARSQAPLAAPEQTAAPAPAAAPAQAPEASPGPAAPEPAAEPVAAE